MSRNHGPTSKINRRFGQNIFPVSKAEERKPYPPGIHGPTKRRKVSEYGTGLNEKQKLRLMYGLSEKQFRLTFARAKKQSGVTGENFLRLLHTRLDNVIYLLGFARTRRAARQFVGHGHISINGHKVDIASYSVSPGDEIEVRDRTSSRQLATRGMEENQQRAVPAWLAVDNNNYKGLINRLPAAEELPTEINVQLIVEFYSR
ncbi:MAG: 30S ribosomal protein S4 [Puniceicoccales bacterium]|jgi:small subunit ribosomal protein S4|nr:30S ribosomal protein S4 [Puniceicoccales bacterium]